MTFSKSYPRTLKGSSYPVWEEISLTKEEEELTEKKAKEENLVLMKECLDEAKVLMKEKGLKEFQTDMVNMAISLFEKRASHVVFYKEELCKEKFDKKFNP